jgi:hypothetical protein
MLLVEKLALPHKMPTPEAIKSWGQNKYSYDPEAWELEYQVVRYLVNLSLEDLRKRHDELLRNMAALSSPDRHVIPINSFLSSWFWYRKEHQTRLEFRLRGEPGPAALGAPTADRPADGVPRPKHPNAAHIVYKYGRRDHMESLVQAGKLRIGPAAYYLDTDIGAARTDNELAKASYLTGGTTTVKTSDGRVQPIIDDLKRTTSAPNYFLFCVAADWDPALAVDFGVDTCAIIENEEEFSRRLTRATDAVLPDWLFHRNPVDYFDPYERRKNEHIDPVMSKDFKFAYQREFRYIWINPAAPEPKDFLFLDLGPLTDIAQLKSC